MKEGATGFNIALVIPTLLIICLFTFTITTPVAAGEIDYRPLGGELRDYLALQEGFYGLYIMDIKSDEKLGINELEEFHAASTFKVPMAMYIYRQVAGGAVDPEQLLAIDPSHIEGGTGFLQFSSLDTQKSVDELVRYAIVYSDNVATNMLLDLVGKKAVKDYMLSLGGELVDYEKNVTCPRDMAMYMQEAVRFAEENSWGEKLLNQLRHTVYIDRIPQPLPDVPVANKIGNWPPTGTYNDIAYVEHPERPYIISVFSRGTAGYNEAARVIREISRRVYAYQSSPALKVGLVLDGKNLALSEQPFITRGVTLVPLRALADAVPEITLGWSESSGAITISSNLSGVKKQVMLNREDEVEIIEGRSYLPVRNLCRLLNLGLVWDPEALRIKISTAGAVDNWFLFNRLSVFGW